MEQCFKVNFKAILLKFTLAFKGQSQIDIFWKKGQKIAQSDKVPLTNMSATFNQALQISCNMMFDPSKKCFSSKITKFQIILYTEKGNKKVGEIHFDVAPFLNERNKHSKLYDVALQKCPDPNARLAIELSADIQKEISKDNISNNSYQTVNVQNLVGNSLNSSSITYSTSSIVPTNEAPKKREEPKMDVKSIRSQSRAENEDPGLKIRQLQQQNRRIRQQLKAKQKLAKQNEQLRRKIKAEEYKSVLELRQKIESGRKQIDKLQTAIKRQVLLQKQVKAIQEQIFKCKYQIMSAFNYANDIGGGKLLFEMQEACGLKEV